MTVLLGSLAIGCGSGHAARAERTVTGDVSPQAVATPPKPSPYRFVKPPIVTFAPGDPNPSTNILYTVVARVNRPLPATAGGVHTLIEVDDVPGESVPLPVSRSPRCYTVSFGAHGSTQRLLHPTAHTQVTVTIRRHHQELASAKVALRQASGIGDRALAPYFRELGCNVKIGLPTRTS
ncbi:MAG: hypothetical protein QOE11_2442 [Solirubrobacteraceae bacterium]|nr:hypothetical protein [Solirubrobacteraceae bacterium]